MARWKALPEGLDPLVVQLVAELRRLKDDSGLSLDQLARRTGYSASSWERYLGGRALAPAGAVRALTTTAGGDETSLLVLRQAAQDAWTVSAGAAGIAELDDSAGPDVAEITERSEGSEGIADVANTADTAYAAGTARPPADRGPLLRAAVNSVVSALVGAALAVLVVQPWHHQVTVVAPVAAPVKAPAPVHYTCSFTQVDGKWYAGNSKTETSLVEDGQVGPDVAELQCLLQHAGIPTGNVDGEFGRKTLAAVIHAQMAHHLDVDGQVGPMTWAALRG